MDHARSRSRRRLAVAAAAVWLLLAGPAWARDPVLRELAPESHHSAVSAEILTNLTKGHYKTITLDDRVSSRIFDSYLKALDPSRSYFHAADVREFEPLRSRFDDLLEAGDLEPAFEVFNRYLERLTQRLGFLIETIDHEFDALDFEKDESLARKNTDWAGSMADLRALWRRQLKGDVLNGLLAGTERGEVREELRQRYASQRVRVGQTNGADAFRVYTNAFLRAVDPHSAYFPPHQSENFNIHMSLSLEGIGAVLQAEGESVKVLRLVAGGPADKAGDLKPGDRIVGVAQGEQGEMVDVLGMRLDDVVSLIRGPKHTTVRLEIVPQVSAAKQRRVIRIVRNKVDLEDQEASSRVTEVEVGGRAEKVGVIRIPTFYVDFRALEAGDPDYKSTVRDVKRLIEELREARVSGLVIDLRDNGGGSLREAIDLVGLFIDRGPVVQVRDGQGLVRIHSDEEDGIVHGGPLAVLVNRLSASASEIFAGAVQDYRRGLVVGGQTFGKGTVQTLIRVGQGRLKLTQAKFYRISGASVQHRGVLPDIELPDLVDKTEVGESSLDHALPWDSIERARYSPVGETEPYFETLARQHRRRVGADPDFVHLAARIDRLVEERAETSVSLREKARRARRERNEVLALEIENARRRAKGEEPFANFAELTAHNEKKAESGTGPADRPPGEDPILDEAVHILADFMALTRSPAVPESALAVGSKDGP